MFFVALVGQAQVALAQVSISEIMYNPKGSDTGHEWVEVVNEGSSDVDLAQCKFVEIGTATTNHGIVAVQGGATLTPGAYAIIADNAQTFLVDHPGFVGVVTDSSFSLNNTGETIAFKMPDGTLDTVSYTKDMGANEDGNSLQKIAGVWHGDTPTPGAAHISVASSPAQELSSNISSATPAIISTNPASSFPVESQIFADAGAALRVVSTGAPIMFTGRVLGIKKDPIENARMVWSFGDGGRAEGAGVEHTYYYPGDYIVVLDAASGHYSASDRVTVHVVTPSLALQTGGDTTHSFVAIENRGGDELDLSEWQVESAGKIFVLPKNTIIGAHKILTLASEVTGLVASEGASTTLRFPNGTQVELHENISRIAPLPVPTQVLQNVPTETKGQQPVAPTHVIAQKVSTQKASVADVLAGTSTSPVKQESGSLWLWYTSVALLGAVALLGLRFAGARRSATKSELTADDFEIVEEGSEDKKDDLF